MPLAYTFWHQPRPAVAVLDYERDLRVYHQALAGVPIPGFVGSWTLRVPDLPWLPGGGYEDWYLIDGFADLGTLNRAAIDTARLTSHDALAATVHDGTAGLYAQLLSQPGRASGERPGAGEWVGWFRKRPGVSYPRLRAELQDQVDGETVLSVWQRQMVLGPAPEFRVEAAAPVRLTGADLAVAVPAVMSG